MWKQDESAAPREKVLQTCMTFKTSEHVTNQYGDIGRPPYIEEQTGSGLVKMRFEATEWDENEGLALSMALGPSHRSYDQQWLVESSLFGSPFTFVDQIGPPSGVTGTLIGLVAERMSVVTVAKVEA